MSRRQLLDLGDSCSRDNTPSSIGEYDQEDPFIDDGASSTRFSPVGEVRSPGLFCTPGPEERPRQSIESDRDLLQYTTVGGQYRSILPSSPQLSQVRQSPSVGDLPGLRRGAYVPEGSRRLLPVSTVASRSPSFGSSTSQQSGWSLPVDRRRKRQGEYSPSVGSSDSDEPLLKRLQRRSFSVASHTSESSVRSSDSRFFREQSNRYSNLGSASPYAQSRRNSGSPRVAGTSGREPDEEPVDEGQSDRDPAFTFPSHLRRDELEGAALPGSRLATGKPRWVQRYFLFTYSQSGPDWEVAEFTALIELLGGKHHIGRERHADGGYHFHCFVDFERTFEFENPHRFCVGDRGDRPPSEAELKSGVLCPGSVHGNILPVPRTRYHTWDYVTKYGDIVSTNLDRPPAGGPQSTRDDKYKGSLSAKTKTEFLDDVKGHSPRDYVIHGANIRKTGDYIYGIDKTPAETQDNSAMGLRIYWNRYPAVRLWFRRYFANPIPVFQATSILGEYTDEIKAKDEAFLLKRGPVKPRPHSLILHGATRLGKTDFARALGAYVYFRGSFNLKKLTEIGPENVEYMIWDDVSWSDDALKKDNYKNWLGGQDNFTVTDRYLPKKDISWSKPCIFLSNHNPLLGLGENDRNWLSGNCTIVDIGQLSDHRPSAICEAEIHETDPTLHLDDDIDD